MNGWISIALPIFFISYFLFDSWFFHETSLRRDPPDFGANAVSNNGKSNPYSGGYFALQNK
jgi:hypothetical protein